MWAELRWKDVTTPWRTDQAAHSCEPGQSGWISKGGTEEEVQEEEEEKKKKKTTENQGSANAEGGTKERPWHWQLKMAMTAHAKMMRTSRSRRLQNRTVEEPVTWRLPANAGMWFVGQILHHGLRSLLGQGMPGTWVSSRRCLLDGTHLNSVHRKSLFVL